MGTLYRRFLALFRRGRLDRDLEEEMRIHLEMKAAETGDPAAARRAFGNPLLLREESKDIWVCGGWTRLRARRVTQSACCGRALASRQPRF